MADASAVVGGTRKWRMWQARLRELAKVANVTNVECAHVTAKTSLIIAKKLLTEGKNERKNWRFNNQYRHS